MAFNLTLEDKLKRRRHPKPVHFGDKNARVRKNDILRSLCAYVLSFVISHVYLHSALLHFLIPCMYPKTNADTWLSFPSFVMEKAVLAVEQLVQESTISFPTAIVYFLALFLAFLAKCGSCWQQPCNFWMANANIRISVRVRFHLNESTQPDNEPEMVSRGIK